MGKSQESEKFPNAKKRQVSRKWLANACIFDVFSTQSQKKGPD